MILERYLFNNIVYSLVNCEENDIPSHIERVYSYWENGDFPIDWDKRYNDMYISIIQNTATKIIDPNNNEYAVIYILDKQVKEYRKIILAWTTRKPFLAMIADYHYTNNIKNGIFSPHYINHISYDFLLPEVGIRTWYEEGGAIEVDRSSEEFKKFYKCNFINKKIKKLGI